MSAKTNPRRIFLFSPAFNVATKIPLLLEELDDLNTMLKKRGLELYVLIVNDLSTDDTAAVLERFASEHPFLTVQHHSQNQGNSVTVQGGYTWAVTHDEAQPGDIVGCLDADGGQTPLTIPRYVKILASGEFDSVCGTIIYPPDSPNLTDLSMLRFLGGLQAELAGADRPFYVQSPGFELHTLDDRLRRVITEQLPAYRSWLTSRHVEFPRHGTHGVIIQMLGVQGAKLHSAYLASFSVAPSRNSAQLIEQAKAALLHAEMVTAYLSDQTPN